MSPPVERALPFARPETLIGIRKWPVKAARAVGDVKTVVRGLELLVTGAKSLPLVPPSSRLPSKAEAWKISVTDGMVTGIAPIGRLIDKLPLVVPSIVLLECPRFSAENSDWNDPDVTRSTSVNIPIVESKNRIVCEVVVRNDSRSENVAVWVMVAEAADRSRRPSRGRTPGMSRRRCRRPWARGEKTRSRTVGRCIVRSYTRGRLLPPKDRANRSRRRFSGSPAWQACSISHHIGNGGVSPTRGRFAGSYAPGSHHLSG
jgi:hypothetical protein